MQKFVCKLVGDPKSLSFQLTSFQVNIFFLRYTFAIISRVKNCRTCTILLNQLLRLERQKIKNKPRKHCMQKNSWHLIPGYWIRIGSPLKMILRSERSTSELASPDFINKYQHFKFLIWLLKCVNKHLNDTFRHLKYYILCLK